MPRIPNIPLFLTWGIPTAAVLASFATLALAILKPDNELPEQYHWEGFQLDRDFDEARRAADHKIRARVETDNAGRLCRLHLETQGEPPTSLTLVLTHATKPTLDRRMTFVRIANEESVAAATYRAACVALPNTHWRAQLKDPSGTWSVRQYIAGPPAAWSFEAQ